MPVFPQAHSFDIKGGQFNDPDNSGTHYNIPNLGVFGPNHGNVGPNLGNVGSNHGVVGTNHGNVGPNSGNVGPNHSNVGPDQGNTGDNSGSAGPHRPNDYSLGSPAQNQATDPQGIISSMPLGGFDNTALLHLQGTMMIQQRDATIQQRNATIQQQNATIQQKNAIIQQQATTIQQKDAMILQKDTMIHQQAETIQRLQQQPAIYPYQGGNPDHPYPNQQPTSSANPQPPPTVCATTHTSTSDITSDSPPAGDYFAFGLTNGPAVLSAGMVASPLLNVPGGQVTSPLPSLPALTPGTLASSTASTGPVTPIEPHIPVMIRKKWWKFKVFRRGSKVPIVQVQPS